MTTGEIEYLESSLFPWSAISGWVPIDNPNEKKALLSISGIRDSPDRKGQLKHTRYRLILTSEQASFLPGPRPGFFVLRHLQRMS